MPEDFELPKVLNAKKDKNFSKWFHQILYLANIIDQRYDVKGCFVWLDYGYKIMLSIKRVWDRLFQKNGYREMYFPLLVPIHYCAQNDKWWAGFKNEAFWVKGGPEGKENYILRPTGEPAMYPMFKLWIRSYTDLPLKVYETVSSFRYETKHTIPLIRDREITVWHEMHTCHATKEEADRELKLQMAMWDKLWKECALWPLKVWKPKWECFPGAVGAVEYYSVMPDGRAMENGSCNNLGQAYAKKFDIKFRDRDGKEKYVWMTCTGNGARLLIAMIAMHGDNRGLVLPPNLAPIQLVIVPIYYKTNKNVVLTFARKIEKMLSRKFRVHLDDRPDKTPGSKFYDWELRGVPIRLEIGPRDVKEKQVIAVLRDTGDKIPLKLKNLKRDITGLLNSMQKRLLEKAKTFVQNSIEDVYELAKLKGLVQRKKIARVFWCGDGQCWDKIKAQEPGIELFGTDLKPAKKAGQCIACGKKTRTIGYVANTY